MQTQAETDYRDPPKNVKEELNEFREKDPNSEPENLTAALIAVEDDDVITAASQLADQEILEEVVHVKGADEINADAKDGELIEE